MGAVGGAVAGVVAVTACEIMECTGTAVFRVRHPYRGDGAEEIEVCDNHASFILDNIDGAEVVDE